MPKKTVSTDEQSSETKVATKVNKAAKGETLFVTDLTANAQHPVRTHEMIVDGNIQSFDFQQRTRLELPYAVAMKFNQAGFEVRDHEGRIVPRPADPKNLSATEGVKLGPDQVVAGLDELSQSALVARAVVLAGGDRLGPTTPRASLIKFIKQARTKLIEAAKPRPVARTPVNAMSEDVTDEVDPKTVDSIFQDADEAA